MSSDGSLDAFRGASVEERVRTLLELRQGRELPEPRLLEEALGDASWRVRKMAVECVQSAEDPEPSIPVLVSLLASEDNAGLRNAAMEALELLGSVAVEPLIACLANPDLDVRKFAVDTLGIIGDRAAFDGLVGCLDDDDVNIRCAAAQSLGQLGSPAAVEPLLAHLGAGELNVDYAILEALGRIEGAEVPLETLEHPFHDSILRKTTYRLLARSGDPRAVRWLLEGIERGSRSERETAASALVDRYEQLEDPTARAELVLQIREGVKLSRILALAEGLEENDLPRMRTAARFLGWSGRPEAVPALLELAREERLATLVHEAFRALGEEALEGLVEAFADVTETTQVIILEAVSTGQAEEGRPAIEAGLASESPDVRVAAIRALAELPGDPVDPLLARLDDEAPEVQRAVVETLGALAPRLRSRILDRVGAELEAPAPRRRSLIAILGLVGQAAEVPTLTHALHDPDPQVRRAAVGALAGIGHPEALGSLLFAVADESDDVRIAAAHALGRFHEPRARDALGVLLEDRSTRVRCAALAGIGSVGGEADLDRIVPSIRSTDPYVATCGIDAGLRVAGSRRSEVVESALSHANPDVVLHVLDTFRGADVPFERYAGTLIDHSHARIRARAAQLAADLGLRAVRPMLERRLDLEAEGEARDALRRAVASLGDP